MTVIKIDSKWLLYSLRGGARRGGKPERSKNTEAEEKVELMVRTARKGKSIAAGKKLTRDFICSGELWEVINSMTFLYNRIPLDNAIYPDEMSKKRITRLIGLLVGGVMKGVNEINWRAALSVFQNIWPARIILEVKSLATRPRDSFITVHSVDDRVSRFYRIIGRRIDGGEFYFDVYARIEACNQQSASRYTSLPIGSWPSDAYLIVTAK